MSTAYKRPSLAIHFTWKPEWPAVKALLPMIEEQLAPFDARPHWAKLFTMAPSRLQSLYARLPDYKELVKHYDPKGKFRNGFLDTNLYSAERTRGCPVSRKRHEQWGTPPVHLVSADVLFAVFAA